MDHLTDLRNELKVLRKGRGLFAAEIGNRIGPGLRHFSDVADDDGPAEIRRKVGTWLERRAGDLPADLRLAILAALAVEGDARLPLYQDRIDWLVTRLDRDSRTIRRRVDEAIDQVAHAAVQEMLAAPSGRPLRTRLAWYTAELRVAVALDRPGTEVIEFRRVVAESDCLETIDLALSVPRSGDGGATPHELTIDVFHGGTLVHSHYESSTRIGFSLRLPERLHLGQAHEFTIRYRLEPGREIQPHYVCTPKYRCDQFSLHVRFDSTRLPRTVQRIAGLFQSDVTDPVVAAEATQLDTAGEAHAIFDHLATGMSYGLRWQQ